MTEPVQDISESGAVGHAVSQDLRATALSMALTYWVNRSGGNGMEVIGTADMFLRFLEGEL
jgi:hypothetical protein